MNRADVGLLRIAGLPIRFWTAAAAPELFTLLRELGHAADTHTDAARRLADGLGADLVPHPDLTAAQRALVLRVRRTLFTNPTRMPRADEVAEVAALARRLAPALATELADVDAGRARLAHAEATAAAAVERERERLLGLPWELVSGSAVAEAAVRVANPAAYRDLATRVAAGEPWTTKRMRQRDDFLWRMIARGATRATPRGWLGHVVPVTTSRDARGTRLPDVVAAFASDRIDNIHHQRLSVSGRLGDDVLLTMSPLHWDDGPYTQFWVVDAEDRSRLHSVRLRTTAPLVAVRRELRAGAVTLAELETVLGAGQPGARAAVHRFVDHLAGVGVLQLSLPPRRVLTTWLPGPAATATAPVADGATAGTDSYLDVYRPAAGDWSHAAAARLGTLVTRAMRVLAVIDPTQGPSWTDELGERPRPLLDVVAERMDQLADGTAAHTGGQHRHDWPRPADADSPYGRLMAWLAARLDDAGPHDAVDLGPAALTAASVPDRPGDPDRPGGLDHPGEPLDWPVDCLLRPLSPGTGAHAVLDSVEPAAVLDARLADGLRDATGEDRRLTWYRTFLRQLEREAGGRFVEILVPPLSDQAANAVRRPPYTGAWTGDPDQRTYLRGGADAPDRYVPLADITVRHDGIGVRAEVHGEPVWPVYHATRSTPAPWNILTSLLLRASPQPGRWRWRPLRYSLTAWPDRDHVPRLTVGGGELVLTCAQWRVRRAELWDPTDGLLGKARAMERLRHRRGLPRWVTVSTDSHQDPWPCDLESLRAIHVLDRLTRAGATSLLVTEMLPAPDRMPVTDLAHQQGDTSLAELLLRLPLDTDPAVFAARIAPAIAHHQPIRAALAPVG